MNKTVVMLLCAAALTTAACKKEGAPKPADTTTAGTKPADTAQLAAPAKADTPAAPAAPQSAEPVVTHTVVIKTEAGTIEAELYGKDAPKAAENFAGLANKGYFDGIAFHRCIPDFVIQGGDPNSKDPANRAAWGTGGESLWGGMFQDELDPQTPSSKLGYQLGTLAMANSGPNTNGSQFFIITGQHGMKLPHNYTIFGKVTKGMDVVHKIEKTGEHGEIPEKPVHMTTVTAKANDGKVSKKAAGDDDEIDALHGAKDVGTVISTVK